MIDDNTIDLVVTSPPYNLGVKYDIYVDRLPWEDYYRWCRNWMEEIFRVLKPDGRFCLNHYLSFGTSKQRTAPLMNLNCIAENIGFHHHTCAVWPDITRIKYTAWGSWLKCSSPYFNSPFEGILILFKDHWKKDTKGESTITKEEFIEACSGVWKMKTQTKEITKANFPVELPLRCINMLTYKGDLVLDPFMGGGSTAVAAKQSGRNFIGFEISQNYCDISNRRVEEWK